MFVKNFKLKEENAKRIKEMIKREDVIDLKEFSLKSNGNALYFGDVITISFADDRVLGVAVDDEVLGKSIDYGRFSQSLVSRLIATSHRFIPSLNEEEDFEPAREELDYRPATPQEQSQEDKSSDDKSESEEDKSLEELLLETAERTPEVSQSSDALPSEDARELLEEELMDSREEAGDNRKVGSSQPNQTSSENSSGACNPDEPVATGEVSTRKDDDLKKEQVQDCSLTKKELENIKKEIKEVMKELDTQNLAYYYIEGKGKIINKNKGKLKEIKSKIKNKTANSKTTKKLLQKIEKNLKKIEKEILPKAERALEDEIDKAKEKIPMRNFNLPYCYIPSDTDLLDIEKNYKNYINNKRHKRIKKLFKKLLDEVGFEETPRLDKKKLVINLAKYKNPYNSYKQEAEKSYLLLLVDLSGSMASFEELKYPAYAISKEHENVITILNSNAVPFAIIKDGKVAKVETNWEKATDFYEELIKNYNITKVISISDWDGADIYEILMENTNANWIWLDPYCCNVCNYIPQKETTGRNLPDNIKKFKNKISYWYAVGDIDGFINVLEKET